MLLFEFAFAPALVFVSVLLQAANAMLNNTISDNKQAFFLISNFPFQNPKSIRSPGASDSLFPKWLSGSRLRSSFRHLQRTTEKSPASPLAGNLVAEVFNGLADFPARSSNGLLHPAFCTFLMTALMQIGIVQSLTKFLFDRSADFFCLCLSVRLRNA